MLVILQIRALYQIVPKNINVKRTCYISFVKFCFNIFFIDNHLINSNFLYQHNV